MGFDLHGELDENDRNWTPNRHNLHGLRKSIRQCPPPPVIA